MTNQSWVASFLPFFFETSSPSSPPGHDGLGELGERVALAGDLERFVPAERGALYLKPFFGEAILERI